MQNDKENNWFEVGKIIALTDEKERRKFLNDNFTFNNDDEKDNALTLLSDLNTCINDRNLLGCYVIDKNRDIEEILDIFVKINSGGTPLSKPDLLFSTIIAKWKDKDTDAREEFDTFLKNINICDDQSKRFNFNINFLIRTIMYLFDIPVTLNIKNFNKLDIKLLKEKWEDIKNSIVKTKNLLLEFGFDKNGNIKDENIKQEIRKYFIIAQLKNLFGTASNSTLTETRKAIKNQKEFSMDLLKDITLVGNRTYLLDNDNEILHWIDTYKKGSSYAFMILSIIDPDFDSSKKVDEDHLYPESVLNKIPELKDYKDRISNINLLQAKENRKIKNDMPFDEYIKYLKEKGKNPENVIKCLPELDEELRDYSLDCFKIFYEKRRILILNKLKENF